MGKGEKEAGPFSDPDLPVPRASPTLACECCAGSSGGPDRRGLTPLQPGPDPAPGNAEGRVCPLQLALGLRVLESVAAPSVGVLCLYDC